MINIKKDVDTTKEFCEKIDKENKEEIKSSEPKVETDETVDSEIKKAVTYEIKDNQINVKCLFERAQCQKYQSIVIVDSFKGFSNKPKIKLNKKISIKYWVLIYFIKTKVNVLL